ncbi:MAG: PorV/PorQ family protein [Bacteroidetes bacterium]|nr:PorV/PorQ family protein [Bacteroidota bacterium]
MKKYLITLAVIGLVSTAQSQAVRKYSNEFLNIGVGARGLAMSNAQVATTQDVYSNYYNPAGLVHIPNTFQVGIMHSEYFAGIAKYDFVSFAVPVQNKKRVLGFSFYRFGIDDIPNTLFIVQPDGSVDYSKITSFSAADYAFVLNYSQTLPIKGLSFGANAKVIYRQIGKFAKAWGFGLDAGLQYRIKQWRVGFMARDVTGTFNGWTMSFSDAEKQVLLQTNNELPKNSLEVTVPTFQLGAAYEGVFGKKKQFSITPEINFSITTDGKRNVLIAAKPISIDMNAGLDLKYVVGKDIDVSIRTGVGNLQRATDELGKKRFMVSPNVGAGVHVKIISLDYALTNLTTIKDQNDGAGLYSHVISLRLDINKKQKE